MKKTILTVILIGLTTIVLKANTHPVNDKVSLNVIDSAKKVAVDPVCKMKIKTATAKTTVYNKETYFFCSESCKQKFVAEPTKYLKKS